MFVGFIAIIIVLLIIVAAMSTGSTSGTKNGSYHVDATKTATMIADAQNEAKFYFAKHDGTDLTQPGSETLMEYLASHKFHDPEMKNKDKTETMVQADWLGLTTDYTGPYVIASGPAIDSVRFISVPLGPSSAAIQMVGKDLDGDGAVDGVDTIYLKILEEKMNKFFPDNFVGF